MTSFSFGCEGSGEEVGERCSFGDRQGLRDQVPSGGSRHIGSGDSFLGNVLYGSRKGRMILQM